MFEPVPAGHTSLAISVLNNQGLIIEALHALIHHAQHGQLKRGDVVSVFTATRFVYNEMVFPPPPTSPQLRGIFACVVYHLSVGEGFQG
jgi:hypothetical protein